MHAYSSAAILSLGREAGGVAGWVYLTGNAQHQIKVADGNTRLLTIYKNIPASLTVKNKGSRWEYVLGHTTRETLEWADAPK